MKRLIPLLLLCACALAHAQFRPATVVRILPV